MVFRRRTPLRPWQRALRLVWPVIGWGRARRYWAHRISRLPGTAHSIAAGIACGVAASFTPMVGFHILVGAFVAWVIRGNVFAAAIGTLAGNPWTFPLIWLWIYTLGIWIEGGADGASATGIDFAEFFGRLTEATLRAERGFLMDGVWPILRPMLIGALPTAAVVWMLVYFPVRRLVSGMQLRHRQRALVILGSGKDMT